MQINDSVVATFTDHTDAEAAIKKLAAAGFDMKQLSVIGIPKDSVLQYETAIKADGFLVMAHDSTAEMTRARDILTTVTPESLQLHAFRAAVPRGRVVSKSAVAARQQASRRCGHRRTPSSSGRNADRPG